MLKTLNEKLKHMRNTREKCEELAMTMEFLEGGAIKNLKQHLKKYYDNPNSDDFREKVDTAVDKLIEVADSNRKAEDLLHQGIGEVNEEEKVVNQEEEDGKFGYLNWLHRIVDLSKEANSDVFTEPDVENIEDLQQGMIIDAQDYLGGWHLSVVCEIKPDNKDEYLKVNYLEYPKGNRDEWLRKSEVERVSGPFKHSEELIDKDPDNIKKSLQGLRDYAKKFASPNQKAIKK